MSEHRKYSYFLACDGCDAESDAYPSTTEARARSFNNGWRFPARLTPTGTPSTTKTHDVCNVCADDFEAPTPKPASAIATDEEVKEPNNV